MAIATEVARLEADVPEKSASRSVMAIVNTLRSYVDGQLYKTTTTSDIPTGTTWVFDHPFFFILNVAVGGTWPGYPDGTTTFPQTMQVDYVRVYKR